MRKHLVASIVLIGIGLGCTALAPLPTPTPLPTATPTLAPDELSKAWGESWYASDTIHLDSETNIEIEWTQSSHGLFAIWFIYDSEEYLPDPSLYRILVENTTSPSNGVKTYTIPAGDWHLEVEEAHGPWSIVVTLGPR